MHRLLHVFIPAVHAAEQWNGLYADTDVATIDSLPSLFTNIVTAVVAFTGVVLFVMLLVGGFTFLFSGGDPKQVQKAQGTISAAVIGLVIVVSAYVILNIIQTFTGVNVTKFTIGG